MMGKGERMLIVVQVKLEDLQRAPEGNLQIGKATV